MKDSRILQLFILTVFVLTALLSQATPAKAGFIGSVVHAVSHTVTQAADTVAHETTKAANTVADGAKTVVNTVAKTAEEVAEETAATAQSAVRQVRSHINMAHILRSISAQPVNYPAVDKTPTQAPPEYRPSLDKNLIALNQHLQECLITYSFDVAMRDHFQSVKNSTKDVYSYAYIEAETWLKDVPGVPGVVTQSKNDLAALYKAWDAVNYYNQTKKALPDIEVKENGATIKINALTEYQNFAKALMPTFDQKALEVIDSADGLPALSLPRVGKITSLETLISQEKK